MEQDREQVGRIAETAIIVALSVVLGNLKILELPQGGSIAFGTLPILAYALIAGFRPAAVAGTIAGLLHGPLGGGTMIHPVQILLDYGLAYTALALAAVGRHRSATTVAAGVLLAGAAHLAIFTVSGSIFFGAPGSQSVLLYSLTYNAVHVLPEIAVAIWAVPLLVHAYHRSVPYSA